MTFEPRSLEHNIQDAELALSVLEDWAIDEEELPVKLLWELVGTQSAQASATLALVQAVREATETLGEISSQLGRVWAAVEASS